MEYERLGDLGVFEGEPLELIGGQLIVAEPKGSPHAAAVEMAGDALRAALPPGWIVRIQNPLSLDDESAPEPDVAVVRGRHIDYRHAHPTRAALIVEVAESSLSFDRAHKGSLYARAGIADYWIVNLETASSRSTAIPTPISPRRSAGAMPRCSASVRRRR